MNLRREINALYKPAIPSFNAHDFQIEVAQYLLSGKNVILQAPTGGGKTEAALAPYLVARRHGIEDFPLKMFFATPLRTLAKDLHRRAEEIFSSLRENGSKLKTKLHTGEDQNDDFFESDLIVTTIDQLMSGYAHIPLSLGARVANINAGAVVASYIVFDECHLHDPQRAFKTALLMAKELRGITPFLFMTATLSDEMVKEMAEKLNAEVVRVDSDALARIPNQQKVRTFKRHEGALTAASVVEHHENRSLVVCNTVGRAQALFEALKRAKVEGSLPDTHLELIHSKFFPSDRNAKEERLQELMGKGSTHNVILVGTQAIEVGIDVSSEHLHTDLCPANSLLQRVGRCARYAGEVGTVHVYDTLNKHGKRNYKPYTHGDTPSEIVKQWFDKTWDALPKLASRNVDFQLEKMLIDRVHTKSDLDNLSNFDDELHSRLLNYARGAEKRIEGRSLARELIRDIDAVSVIVHDNPESLTTWGNVRVREQLSLYHYELESLYKREANNWTIKVGAFPKEWDYENEGRPPLIWVEPDNSKGIFSGFAICLNPLELSYNSELGLRFAPEGEVFESPIKKRESQPWDPLWYTYESYELHIERVMKAARKEVREVFRIAPKVDAALGLPPGLTEALICAAIAAHDFGKLSVGWQGWSRYWQNRQGDIYKDGLWEGEFSRRKPTEQTANMYSAHTDYHGEYDKQAQKDFTKACGRRPGHALESAMLFENLFAPYLRNRYGEALGKQKLLDCLSAATKAICKHHGADTQPSKVDRGKYSWQLDQGAETELARVFRRFCDWTVDESILASRNVTFFRDSSLIWDGPKSVTGEHWLLYSLIVRALRLGDQKSFPRDLETL